MSNRYPYPPLFVGDFGIKILLTVVENGTALDVSSATSLTLIMELPDGSTITRTMSFGTDGTDGVLEYTLAADDLTMAGTWYARAQIASPTFQRTTAAERFVVSS